jgi:hypothetical protein
MFMEDSGLLVVQPELDISFSSPAGYLELLETVKAYGWELARRLGRLPSPEELGTAGSPRSINQAFGHCTRPR